MIEAPSFFPLGSVVKLEDEDQLFMIITRGVTYQNGDEIVYNDYRMCLYPEGHTNALSIYCDHGAITEVVYRGYEGDMDTDYLDVLKKALEVTELTRGKALPDDEAW